MARAAPKAGETLGNYVIRGVLGVGGMGIVYLAEHARLKRKVAVKLLRPELSTDANIISRFFAEARAVNAIGHDNIIEITDFVEEGDFHYFVMELLKGQTLSKVLKAERLPLWRTLHIATQIASALGAAHEAGVVHRDLKPPNVFLIRRGMDNDFVKVLDFGVAKMHGAEQVDQTTPGTVVGTPQYMAPEQFDGTAGDHRIDIYAFGVLLYQMCTGVRPFKGSTFVELVKAHALEVPEPPSSRLAHSLKLPDALEQLILKCLGKTPDERPASMAEVVATLERVAQSVPRQQAAPAAVDLGSFAIPTEGGFVTVDSNESGPNPISPSPDGLTPSKQLRGADDDFVEDELPELSQSAVQELPAEARAALAPTPAPAAAELPGFQKEPSGTFKGVGTAPTVIALGEPAPASARRPLQIAAAAGAAVVVAAVVVGIAVIVSGPEDTAEAAPPDPVAAVTAPASVPSGETPPASAPSVEAAPPASAPADEPATAPPGTTPAKPPVKKPVVAKPAAAPVEQVQVSFNSLPAGATVKVQLGGKLKAIGVTPLSASLPSGSAKVQLELAGYQSWSTTVTLKEGSRIGAALRPAPKP